jgi:hypothetical protein
MPRTKEPLFFRSWEIIGVQLAHMVARKKVRKNIQFSTILHLLQQGHPMLEYESLQPLYMNF